MAHRLRWIRHPRRGRLLVLLGAVALSGTLAAQAPQGGERRLPGVSSGGARRVALVIGNNAYPAMPLRNAVNDARVVAETLAELGWETTLVVDGSKKGMDTAISAYVGRIGPGDEALFFYAGHGLQIEGENYLVPVDFRATDESDAKYDGVALGRIHDKVAAAGARLNVLILDACRDNPFKTSRSGAGGLAEVRAARGSLIAFATAPGRTAADNAGGRNSVFTAALVGAMKKPGLDHNQVLDEVRETVHRVSGGAQLPWTTSAVVGRFVFNQESTLSGTPEEPRPLPGADAALRAEVAFWESVKDSQDVADFEAYLNRFPSGTYEPLARRRLAVLRAARGSVAPAQVTPPPPIVAVRVGGEIDEPRKIWNVSPIYPAEAVQAGVQGVVVLECTVGVDGRVTDARVVRGVPLLDQPAIDAVRQWIYAPAQHHGVRVPVIMTVTVNFRLN